MAVQSDLCQTRLKTQTVGFLCKGSTVYIIKDKIEQKTGLKISNDKICNKTLQGLNLRKVDILFLLTTIYEKCSYYYKS